MGEDYHNYYIVVKISYKVSLWGGLDVKLVLSLCFTNVNYTWNTSAVWYKQGCGLRAKYEASKLRPIINTSSWSWEIWRFSTFTRFILETNVQHMCDLSSAGFIMLRQKCWRFSDISEPLPPFLQGLSNYSLLEKYISSELKKLMLLINQKTSRPGGWIVPLQFRFNSTNLVESRLQQ